MYIPWLYAIPVLWSTFTHFYESKQHGDWYQDQWDENVAATRVKPVLRELKEV